VHFVVCTFNELHLLCDFDHAKVVAEVIEVRLRLELRLRDLLGRTSETPALD
jgi:hypothetical protein